MGATHGCNDEIPNERRAWVGVSRAYNFWRSMHVLFSLLSTTSWGGYRTGSPREQRPGNALTIEVADAKQMIIAPPMTTSWPMIEDSEANTNMPAAATQPAQKQISRVFSIRLALTQALPEGSTYQRAFVKHATFKGKRTCRRQLSLSELKAESRPAVHDRHR